MMKNENPQTIPTATAPIEVSATEAALYAAWEQSSAFASGRALSARPYTIMMPPPNVTGNLHMGHALTFTLQDILIRHARKQGFDTLWQPGTDHAGISTQMVVERELAKEGLDRREMGREAFEARVWAWKDTYGAAITHQLRRLGATPDWPRERFTLDEGLKHAVTSVFVQMFKEGLIYRDQRLVHWDTKLLTAISDIEVDTKEIDDQFCFLRYPLADDPQQFLVVATTRPETLFGDVAVAVHPEDERYQAWIGKQVRLPLTDRTLPVVADSYCDPDKGTGAVKITPAHDFNDFEVAKRQNLPTLNILTETGFLNEHVPTAFQGLTCAQAREKVLEALQDQDLIEKLEPIRHSVPHGDRTGVRVEPRLTDQWYVDAHTLAQPAIRAVETGEVQFFPEFWSATYFEWLRNIQPWCISRQLWWGHRIPAWYGPDGKIFVEMTELEAQESARRHYGHAVELCQDPDVLDTWFSSGLWPFSTLGWPEASADLKRYYPSDVLVTGNDIIFFWVARMMMMGLHFMKAPPFREIYIHALVRDEKGQKMSKSKGNVVDPLGLMDQYGTDALRFALALQAAPGRDIKLSPTRVEGARNFATKLRNATRFCLMNGAKPGFDIRQCRLAVNLWMVDKVEKLAVRLHEALRSYRFHEAAQWVQRESWGSFCDWYVEFCKPIFNGADAQAKDETQQAAFWILSRFLDLLNPFMPFVTEELWAQLYPPVKGQLLADAPLITAQYPVRVELPQQTPDAVVTMELLIEVISAVRAVFAEFKISPHTRLKAFVKEAPAHKATVLQDNMTVLLPMARLDSLTLVPEESAADKAEGVITLTLGDMMVGLHMAGAIDIAKEKQRLEKEIARLAADGTMMKKKLENTDFIARAPREIVEELQARAGDTEAKLVKNRQTLLSLS